MALTRSDFASDDLDEFTSAMAGVYGSEVSATTSGESRFAVQQSAATDGVVTTSLLTFDGGVHAVTEGFRDVWFVYCLAGRYAWQCGGAAGDQQDAFVLPSDRRVEVDFDGVRSVSVQVEAPTVDRWLARHGGLSSSPALSAMTGSAALAHTLQLYARVMPTETFDSELVRANLLELLLSVMAADLLRDGRGEGPERSSAGLAAPAALRRAEEYFRAHAAEPVSVADAAEAARLSVRGLQAQFQRWLQVTPAHYLRSIRLDEARAELVAASRDGRAVTVAQVARRWGFAHAGRFSAYYADAFGETPGRTLRKGPR